MAILGLDKLFNRNKDLNKSIPDKRKIMRSVIQMQQLRTIQDMADYRDAVRKAEDILAPDRAELIEIYKDVVLDGHVSGIISAIKNNIKSRKFAIVNSEEEEDEKVTDVINQEWFFDFIDYAIDAKFWGYSLIQLGDIVSGTFKDIELIPREYVVPEWEIVKKSLYTSSKESGISINSNQYKDWLIFINSKDLGLLNLASPHAISKKALFSAAWEHAEIFGMPMRVGKTNLTDNDRRLQMEDMLKNMGTAAYAVLDKEDEVDFVENSKSDIYKIYIEPMRFSNAEISKAFAGQTMMFDDGSSLSQSEVHERLFNEFIMTYMRFVVFVVNNKLMPLMVKHGLITSDVKFKFISEENISVMERKEIVADLADKFHFDGEFVSRYLGIEVENKEPEQSVDVPANAMQNAKTYTDYPKKASENARKVLRWRDEHGDEVKAMTRTGWARANQLAKRKPITFETIKRMAAFVRHKENSKIDTKYKATPWKDNGYVAWLGWGGDAGINWAIRKVQQIESGDNKNLMINKLNDLYD